MLLLVFRLPTSLDSKRWKWEILPDNPKINWIVRGCRLWRYWRRWRKRSGLRRCGCYIENTERKNGWYQLKSSTSTCAKILRPKHVILIVSGYQSQKHYCITWLNAQFSKESNAAKTIHCRLKNITPTTQNKAKEENQLAIKLSSLYDTNKTSFVIFDLIHRIWLAEKHYCQ